MSVAADRLRKVANAIEMHEDGARTYLMARRVGVRRWAMLVFASYWEITEIPHVVARRIWEARRRLRELRESVSKTGMVKN